MKITSTFLLIIVVICVQSTSVFGWGSATHTYLAKELGSQYGLLNLNEMYGAVVPDMFNLLFGHPDQDYLWNETHYEFIKVVNKARLPSMKAFAYGFESHNEEYGADKTAHIQSAIWLPGGPVGYVNYKRELLASVIQPNIESFLKSVGIKSKGLAKKLALRISDTAVESAVDYLVSRNEDPYVGTRMLAAAGARSQLVPLLLCRAYAFDYMNYSGMSFEDAAFVVYLAEAQFREYMIYYGGIFSQANALDSMVELGAQLAEKILEKEYHLVLTVPRELIRYCLDEAIKIVEGDYADELAATLAYLEGAM